MHLKPEEFIDVADGARPESAYPHLGACEVCRRQLADVRATVTSLMDSGDAMVPEPPPFFWTQFQNRVTAAVKEQERPNLARRLRWLVDPRVLAPLAAIAVLALSISFGGRAGAPPVLAPGLPTAATTTTDPLEDPFDDDPSLQLVADLAGSIDLSAASDAGLTPRGSADHAVTHLDAQELQELQRLLKAELGT
jgi:hypothetical protein